jgi:hypothetical protein
MEMSKTETVLVFIPSDYSIGCCVVEKDALHGVSLGRVERIPKQTANIGIRIDIPDEMNGCALVLNGYDDVYKARAEIKYRKINLLPSGHIGWNLLPELAKNPSVSVKNLLPILDHQCIQKSDAGLEKSSLRPSFNRLQFCKCRFFFRFLDALISALKKQLNPANNGCGYTYERDGDKVYHTQPNDPKLSHGADNANRENGGRP